MVIEPAYLITFGDGFQKLQLPAVCLSDPVVTAHGNVAEDGDLLVCTACLLPCLYQRTVMKINSQHIICALSYFHLKNPLGRFCEQLLSQPFKAVRTALFNEIDPLPQSASADRGTAELLPGKPSLSRLIAEQIKPGSPLLQLPPYGLDQGVFNLWFIVDP